MAIEKDFFRQVMGRFATGVSVVTTRGEKGLSGLTVNSFCSVSLDPPLVLICVDLTSNTLSYIRESGIFAVNILTDQQEDFSRCFATSSEERYTYFCHASFHEAATSSPILDGALAFIDTRVVAEYPGGDHVIFLGQVVAMGVGGQIAFADETCAERSNLLSNNGNITIGDKAAPLAYYRGQYRHLAPDYQKPSLAPPRDEVLGRSKSDG
ncbi:MAG TPA: flavin reductase family protein [Ktedonobacteraceae bacterium]|nr:flavin reductase family protein [Ktedonobacteraceae bacterium]